MTVGCGWLNEHCDCWPDPKSKEVIGSKFPGFPHGKLLGHSQFAKAIRMAVDSFPTSSSICSSERMNGGASNT